MLLQTFYDFIILEIYYFFVPEPLMKFFTLAGDFHLLIYGFSWKPGVIDYDEGVYAEVSRECSPNINISFPPER